MQDHSDIEKLEKLIGQLQGLHSEMTMLAKKSPNDAVNSFKIGLVNKVISSGNVVLAPKYLPFDNFDIFNTDDIPSTSDVALVLAQYIEEAERYRSDSIKYWQGRWVYVVKGEPTDVSSGAPTKVGRK